MKVERIVLDTNVLISAVLSSLGKPFACLDWVLDNATLIVSRELLEELETRLARPKFRKYVDDSRRRAFIADLDLSAVQVELSGAVTVCRDPDDNKLLEIAIAGRGLPGDGRSGSAGSRPIPRDSNSDASQVPHDRLARHLGGLSMDRRRSALRSPTVSLRRGRRLRGRKA